MRSLRQKFWNRKLLVNILNIAAIVIYWNTAHLYEAVRQRKHAGLTVEPDLLAHISLLEFITEGRGAPSRAVLRPGLRAPGRSPEISYSDE